MKVEVIRSVRYMFDAEDPEAKEVFKDVFDPEEPEKVVGRAAGNVHMLSDASPSTSYGPGSGKNYDSQWLRHLC